MGHAETECQAVLSRLFEYLDGEVVDEDRGAIDRHLEVCVDCARRFGFEAELKAIIRRKCEGKPVPKGLSDLVRSRVRAIFG